MKVTVILIVIGALGTRIGKEIGRVGNKRKTNNHPDYNIIKIGQNTEKSLGDLRRLAVNQTSVKNSQGVIW